MSQNIDVANMLTYVAPDFPQPPDELVGGVKTSRNDDKPDPQLERAVVVSRFYQGRWVPTSVAQTYGDGRRVTYQKTGERWSNGRVSLANIPLSTLADPLQRARLSMPVPDRPELPLMPPLPMPAQISAGGARKEIPVSLDGSDVRTAAVASNSGIGLQFYYHKNGVNIFSECLLRVINARVDFELNI